MIFNTGSTLPKAVVGGSLIVLPVSLAAIESLTCSGFIDLSDLPAKGANDFFSHYVL